MKEFYPVKSQSQPNNYSLSLLILSFVGGWILATWIFYLFGHSVGGSEIPFPFPLWIAGGFLNVPIRQPFD
jgi:hypothetical protein